MTARKGWFVIYAAAIAIAIAAAITFATGPKAQPTVGLPFATSTSVGTSSTAIIGANPSRRSISICNPSSTAANVCNVAPTGITPTTGATAVGVGLAALTCFTPPSNVMNSGTGGGAGAGWNGICNAASQSLIVLEW